MNAYMSNGADFVSIVVSGLLAALVAGFAITRIQSVAFARNAAWLLVIAGVSGIERLTCTQPPGFRMLAIIGMLLFCMKVVVAVESRVAGNTTLQLLNWFGFAALWPGMRAALFADVPRPARDGAADLVRLGMNRFAVGCMFVIVARLIWTIPGEWIGDPIRRGLATLILLPGISLILHFGVFNILAGYWRSCGANCRPLFRAPLLSRSLTEFWGQRWNLAFSEMTAIGIFRPLRKRIGTRVATAVAFVFSGLLHEFAISVPVKAGFGLPLLYFSLHAVAIFIEKHLERTGRPVHQNVWVGRLWTVAWLIVPLPILFHEPFLNGCVWPLIGMETR